MHPILLVEYLNCNASVFGGEHLGTRASLILLANSISVSESDGFAALMCGGSLTHRSVPGNHLRLRRQFCGVAADERVTVIPERRSHSAHRSGKAWTWKWSFIKRVGSPPG